MILDNYWGYKNKKAANKLLLFLYTIFYLKTTILQQSLLV